MNKLVTAIALLTIAFALTAAGQSGKTSAAAQKQILFSYIAG